MAFTGTAVLLLAVLLAVPARAAEAWRIRFFPAPIWQALGYSPNWHVFWMCGLRLIHARDGLQERTEEILDDVKKRCAESKPAAKPTRQEVTA